MLEEVTSDTLTEVGAADGATKHRNWYYASCIVGSYKILNTLQVYTLITKKNVRIENLNIIQPDMQKNKWPGALERQ